MLSGKHIYAPYDIIQRFPRLNLHLFLQTCILKELFFFTDSTKLSFSHVNKLFIGLFVFYFIHLVNFGYILSLILGIIPHKK